MKKRFCRLLALLLCICMLLPAVGALGISPEEAVARVGTEMELPAQAVQASGLSAADIENGSYVSFGKHYGDALIWRVINKTDDGRLMLFLNRNLLTGEFDAAGVSEAYHEQIIYSASVTCNDGALRETYGSNNWEESNVRQFLNSEDDAVSYTHCSPSYLLYNGFLSDSNFTSAEKAILCTTANRSLLDYVDSEQAIGGGGYLFFYQYQDALTKTMDENNPYYEQWYSIVYDKMFLLDLAEAQNYYKQFSWEQVPNFWLRTPTASGEPCYGYYGTHNIVLSSYSNFSASSAYSKSHGIRPACYIRPGAEAVVSGSGTNSDPYVFTLPEITPGAANITRNLDADHCYVRVLSRNGKEAVAGEAFMINGIPYTTNQNGIIAIPGTSAQTVTIYLSSRDRYAFTSASLHLLPGQIREITLPAAASGGTQADSALSHVFCDGTDILAHAVTAAFNSGKSWQIEADATIEQAQEIRVLCDGETVASIPPGSCITLRASDLKAGSSVWVQVVAQDGTAMQAVKTRLTVYDSLFPGAQDDFTIKVGPDLAVTLPESIPLLGGNTFSLDWGSLPAAIEVEEDTIRIGIGLEAERDTDPESATYGKLKNSEVLKNWKKLCDDAKDAKKAYKQFRKLGAKNYAKSALGKKNAGGSNLVDLDIAVFGYGEFKLRDGKPGKNALEVRVLVEAKWFEHTWQTAVWVIPIVVEFELGSELDGKLRGEIDLKNGNLNTSATLKITPLYVKPSAGIGLANIASVGVYGKGSFNVGFGPMEGYHYGELEGEAGARAHFLLYTDEWPFWKDSLELWEHYPNSAQSVSETRLRSAAPIFNAQGQIASDGFRLAERGYLGAQSAWRGGGSAPPGLVRSNGDSPMRTTRALQTSIYGDARVRMGRVGADTLLVWLQDDAGRSAQNRTKLVYALYDASTGVWSEPAAVWDDGTADFMPALGTDGSSLYVAWQDSKTEFASGVTLAQMAAAGEISLARFDTASKTFVDAKRLTDNDVLDTNPAVAAFHGTAHVAWSRNAANDILNQSGGNDILYYDGSGESVSASGRGPLLALEIGDVSGAVQIAYVEDGDGYLQSADDQYLYLGTPGGSPTQMQAGAQNPRMGYLGGSGRLFYAENGALMQSAGGMGAAVEGFADTVYGFELINGTANDTAILTIEPKAEQDGSDVYVHTYESAAGTWSGAVQLSVTSAYAESPDGVILENGAILSVFTRTAASVGADDVSTSSDLCESLLQRTYDLAITDVSYDEAAVGSDAALAVEITVENRGALGVSGVQLNMAAGNGAAAPITLNQSIPAGGSALLCYDLAMPETITPTSYTVSVEPVGGTDADPGDNTMAVVIGYTDLALHVRQVGTGSVVGAEVEVENISASATEATLYVRDGSTAGEVLGKLDMGSIAPGTRASAYIDGTEVSQMRAMAASDTLCIEVVSAVPEESTVDNSATIEAEKKLLTYMKLGDANGDGAISLADAVRLAQIVTKAYTETDPNAYAALDIDMDDEITVLDVIYVCRYLVGIRD